MNSDHIPLQSVEKTVGKCAKHSAEQAGTQGVGQLTYPAEHQQGGQR